MTPCWAFACEGQGHVNLYEVVSSLVKPWTRNTGCSIALRMNPEEPQVAKLMVSHSWLECMDQCSEALNKYCTRQKLLKAVILWFCAFAQYQPGDESGDRGPTVAEQLSMDPFGSVIRNLTSNSLGLVVIQTSLADVYTRLWCVYEIAEAMSAKVRVKMAYSQLALETRNGTFEEMLRAKTSRASCRDPADEKMIREKVQQSGGFGRLDSIIFEFRVRAFEEMMHELEESAREQLLSEIQRFARLATVTQLATGGLSVMARVRGSTGGMKWMLCCVSLAFVLVCLVSIPFIAMASSSSEYEDVWPPEPITTTTGATTTTTTTATTTTTTDATTSTMRATTSTTIASDEKGVPTTTSASTSTRGASTTSTTTTTWPVGAAEAPDSQLWLWILGLALALAIVVVIFCAWRLSSRRTATATAGPQGPEPELVGRSLDDDGQNEGEVMQQRMAMARQMAPQLFS
eukprot:Skav211335  [mRNA]  locus=scaffold3120:184194:185573:+ [translate_table: standard]